MDMIPFNVLLSFIATCTIIELTPGPNMAYLAVLSASDGRRAGFFATLGIALGLLTVGIAAALGLAALVSSSTFAFQILRWGGVFYLLWLAWDGWKNESETSPGKSGAENKSTKFFKRGLIVNLLNPKAAVFYVAILPEFINASSHIVSQAVALTITYVLIATTIHCTIVMLAGTAREFLQDDHRRLIARRVLSIALALIALWFAYTTNQ
jgi:threonine/homoserine/homoserine lactone efflux protein